MARWRSVCPSCGATQQRTHAPAQAIPVAPLDDELPFADAVDEADDIPIATLVEDEDDIPVAPVVRRRRRRPPRPPSKAWRLIPMFIGYVVMLGISIAWGVMILITVMNQGQIDEEQQNWGLFAVEAIDAVLILGVALLVGRITPHPLAPGDRLCGWFVGFPMLAVLLTLNVGFMLVLRRLLDTQGDLGPELSVVTVLLICVQPALFEEWFFRHLALGTLRQSLGMHWGVWISGAMFAFAHLFNPFGMPYLFVLGVSLGYLRVLSGSLALPMILHFIHNLVVLITAQWAL
jgi:membrane protease YdiL (CAAX protease family)